MESQGSYPSFAVVSSFPRDVAPSEVQEPCHVSYSSAVAHVEASEQLRTSSIVVARAAVRSTRPCQALAVPVNIRAQIAVVAVRTGPYWPVRARV